MRRCFTRTATRSSSTSKGPHWSRKGPFPFRHPGEDRGLNLSDLRTGEIPAFAGMTWLWVAASGRGCRVLRIWSTHLDRGVSTFDVNSTPASSILLLGISFQAVSYCVGSHPYVGVHEIGNGYRRTFEPRYRQRYILCLSAAIGVCPRHLVAICRPNCSPELILEEIPPSRSVATANVTDL